MRKLIFLAILTILSTTGVLFAGNSTLSVSAFAPVASSEAIETADGFLLKFDLSGLPEGDRIDAAMLQVTVTTDTDSIVHLSLFLIPVVEAWSASEFPVSLSSIFGVADTLIQSAILPDGSTRTTTIDVTGLARRWLSEEIPNEGVYIRSEEIVTNLELSKPGASYEATLLILHSQ